MERGEDRDEGEEEASFEEFLQGNGSERSSLVPVEGFPGFCSEVEDMALVRGFCIGPRGVLVGFAGFFHFELAGDAKAADVVLMDDEDDHAGCFFVEEEVEERLYGDESCPFDLYISGMSEGIHAIDTFVDLVIEPFAVVADDPNEARGRLGGRLVEDGELMSPFSADGVLGARDGSAIVGNEAGHKGSEPFGTGGDELMDFGRIAFLEILEDEVVYFSIRDALDFDIVFSRDPVGDVAGKVGTLDGIRKGTPGVLGKGQGTAHHVGEQAKCGAKDFFHHQGGNIAYPPWAPKGTTSLHAFE